MRRVRVRTVAALLALLGPGLASCEGGSPPGAGGASGPGDPPFDADGLPHHAAVEAVRLGGAEAPEPETFVRAPPLAVGRDGALFALEPSTNEVRRFGPDGSFLGTMGGMGEGPGELRNAYRLGLVGDTVWVRNLSPPFVSFFATDGTYLRTERYDDAVISRSGVPEGPEGMLAGGRWFTVGVVPWGSPSGPVEVPLLIGGPGSGTPERDTLATAVDPAVAWVEGLGTLRAVGYSRRPPLHDVVPGGEAVLTADWGRPGLADGTVVLRRFRPDASLAGEDTVRFPPVPLEPRVADSLVAAATDSARARVARIRASGVPEPPELPDEPERVIREALSLGSALPPVRRLVAGVDGTVWLERLLGPATGEWVVLDGDARPLFRTRLPEGTTLAGASRDAVWGTHTDELDVPWVVRYDLVAEDGPPSSR